MSWSTRPTNTLPTQADIEDGIATNYIQKNPDSPVFPDPGTNICQPWEHYETYVTLTAGGVNRVYPTRAEVEANRAWDPDADIPSNVAATTQPIGVSVSWTEDPDIPSTDGSWARNQIEIVVLRSTSSGGTYSEIGTKDYGNSPFADSNGTQDQTYWYKLQYRNKSDGSLVGSLTSAVSAVFGGPE